MEIKMPVIPGNKPGVVGTINVKLNDYVHQDDVLVNIETGKGNRVIKATTDGIIEAIHIEANQEVKAHELLFTIKEESLSTYEDTDILMGAIAGTKPGIVGKLNVKINDYVHVDDVLVNIETGKGNRVVKASVEGTIKAIHVKEGDEIKSNALLMTIQQEIKTSSTEETTLKEETKESDLVIIGAGPGGYVAAIYAAMNHLKVTLVEKYRLGGTCLNVGCIPTKSLVKSSEAYHEASHLDTFGLHLEGHLSYDMKDLIHRKNHVVDTLVGGIDSLMKQHHIDVVYGDASFINSNEVLVKGKDTQYRLTYKDIIIATGSSVSIPRIDGIDLPCVMDSTKALSHTENLKTITIVGGGVIGMEFACLYHNLGIKVNVVEYLDRVVPMVDHDISHEFLNIIKQRGMNVYTQAAVTRIQETLDGEAIVTFKQNNQEHTLVSDKVIVATGRKPNIEGLNLDVLQLTMNEQKPGIHVNEYMQTNVEHIYAIGDVTNIIQLAHVASHQGIVAVDHILGHPHPMDYRAVPNVIFSAPEIASVGLTENECKQQGIDYKVSRFDYIGNGKALTMNQTEGFVKLIKDAQTNQLIGASFIGADASSLISAVTLAIQNKLTDEQVRATIFAHPTTSEVIHEAAMGLGIGCLHQ